MNTDPRRNENIENDNKNHTTNDKNEKIEELYLHCWVDCQDYLKKWYEAQIIEIDVGNGIQRVKVHYKGWKSKFDEWIDLNSANKRIRPLHSFTKRPPSYGNLNELHIGMRIDCKDSADQWYEAEIIGETKKLIQVHYLQWSDEYNEWINKDSYRIAPLHTMTKARTNHSQVPAPQSVQNTNMQSSNSTCTQPQTTSNRRCSNNNRNMVVRSKCRRSIPNKNDKNHHNNMPSRAIDGLSRNYPPNDNNNIDVDNKYENIEEVINTNDNNNCQQSNGSQKNLRIIHGIVNNCSNLSEEEKRKLKNARIRLNYISRFHATRADEEYFRQLMNNIGLVIVDMGDDGNCLFRSISHQIYGTQDHHALIRAKIVEYLETEIEYYADFVEGGRNRYQGHCERMKINGVCGDNLEIQAISEIYNKPIEIYAYSNEPLKIYSNDITNPSNNPNRSPIRLSYHFNGHYNSIIDPKTHNHCIEQQRAPGDIENERIRFSKLRLSHVHQSNNENNTNNNNDNVKVIMEMSDIEMTDLQYYNIVLEESRRTFLNSNIFYDTQIFDNIVQNSLKQEKEDMNKACKMSLQADESKDVNKIEEIQMQSAKLTSLLDSTYPSSEPLKQVVAKGYTVEEAEEAYWFFSEYKMMTNQQLVDNMIEYLKQKQSGILFN